MLFEFVWYDCIYFLINICLESYLHSIFHHADAFLSKFTELFFLSLFFLRIFPMKRLFCYEYILLNIFLLWIYFSKYFLKRKENIFFKKEIWLLFRIVISELFLLIYEIIYSSLICCNMNIFLKIVDCALNLHLTIIPVEFWDYWNEYRLCIIK